TRTGSRGRRVECRSTRPFDPAPGGGAVLAQPHLHVLESSRPRSSDVPRPPVCPPGARFPLRHTDRAPSWSSNAPARAKGCPNACFAGLLAVTPERWPGRVRDLVLESKAM